LSTATAKPPQAFASHQPSQRGISIHIVEPLSK
jgi:hypothetical protein